MAILEYYLGLYGYHSWSLYYHNHFLTHHLIFLDHYSKISDYPHYNLDTHLQIYPNYPQYHISYLLIHYAHPMIYSDFDLLHSSYFLSSSYHPHFNQIYLDLLDLLATKILAIWWTSSTYIIDISLIIKSHLISLRNRLLFLYTTSHNRILVIYTRTWHI